MQIIRIWTAILSLLSLTDGDFANQINMVREKNKKYTTNNNYFQKK